VTRAALAAAGIVGGEPAAAPEPPEFADMALRAMVRLRKRPRRESEQKGRRQRARGDYGGGTRHRRQAEVAAVTPKFTGTALRGSAWSGIWPRRTRERRGN